MNGKAQPEIVNRSDFKVAGWTKRGNNAQGELSAMWQQFITRYEELRPFAKSGVAYGVIDNFDEGEGTFDYMTGVEVQETDGLPDELEVWQILAQNYAVFPTTLATLMETMDSIYNAWMPRSNYRRAPGPEFEYYEELFDPEVEGSRFYLYIPVEPLAGGE